MPDIHFGFCVPIFAFPGVGLFRTPGYAALDPAMTMALGRAADQLGYDSLWVADHLMLGQDDAILEGWTTLAALAGATQRARLVVGASPDGTVAYDHVRYTHPTVLVLGEERRGLTEDQRALCQQIVRIPMLAGADSLNLGVAGSLLMYEVVRASERS